MAHRILVTGCARASTGYHAKLLSLAGIACGHEALFNPESALSSAPSWPSHVAAESSWLAAPHLATLPRGTVVLHVVREPRLALASLWRIGLVRTRSAYREFAERHCPALAAGTAQERTARYWLEWNRGIERECARAGLRMLRVRSGETSLALLRELFALAARPFDTAAAVAALAAVPPDTNTAGDRRRDAAVDWSSLAGTELGGQVEALAERYGLAPACFADWRASLRLAALFTPRSPEL